MRKSIPLRVDPVLLRAAKTRAQAEHKTLDEYVETALRRQLGRKPIVTVTVPKQLRKTIRKSKLVPRQGATRAERKQDKEIFEWLLDSAGIGR